MPCHFSKYWRVPSVADSISTSSQNSCSSNSKIRTGHINLQMSFVCNRHNFLWGELTGLEFIRLKKYSLITSTPLLLASWYASLALCTLFVDSSDEPVSLSTLRSHDLHHLCQRSWGKSGMGYKWIVNSTFILTSWLLAGNYGNHVEDHVCSGTAGVDSFTRVVCISLG